MIKGRDVIAQAQSGTGKTATFCIGTLQNIDPKLMAVQALVLAPTRELAKQNAKVFEFLGEYMGVVVKAFVGGSKIENDRRALENGVHVVVGTPGRIIDMINRKYISLSDLKLFVLDEADEMLSRGFLENIKEVIKHITETAQICLFSATMPKEIVQLTTQFMNDPAKILVKKEQLTLDGIRQFFIPLKREWKDEILLNLYKTMEIHQAMIYCNKKSTVDNVTKVLQENGFIVSSMHAEMDQEERDRVMKEFRVGATRVLVTTDLLARGIDVYQVSLVVNYDIPLKNENYIHRIGRSGRFGRKGTAINFMCPEDKENISNIMKMYDTNIEELPKDLSEIK